MGFDFQKAFGRPVKIINDAAMQALGSYRGGHMLFLGLGTGLGSALVVDGALEPMELAHLPYRHGKTFEEYVGAPALKRLGKKKWVKNVFEVVARLKNALQAEYVVLGGGNANRLAALPLNTFRGDNENARTGGIRLWQPHTMQRTTLAPVCLHPSAAQDGFATVALSKRRHAGRQPRVGETARRDPGGRVSLRFLRGVARDRIKAPTGS